MGLTVDIYANDGSPLGVIPEMIWTRGVGGAELALMTWAEVMAKRGHQVRIYNNPPRSGDHNGVTYLPQGAFSHAGKRDVFIAFRSPNPFVRTAKADVKIHWSCDQYTVGNFRNDILPFVDHVVCISPFHKSYYEQHYGGHGKVDYFDLGVRLEDYDLEIEKVPGRCIFCSVPDRGLQVLRQVWPRIRAQVPEATLVITSDYRLWGVGPNNHQHRMSWLQEQGVEFLGAIPRRQLIEEQLKAVCQPYPAVYEELFCISAAECQVAGATPVTTTIGALETTNEFGLPILGDDPTNSDWQANFVETVTSLLEGVIEVRSIDEFYSTMQANARRRFDWNVICGQWERLIETGEFSHATEAVTV